MTATQASRRLSTDTPIVVFGDDWGRNVSTMQHLFRFVALKHPVIWINGIGHRLPNFLRFRDLKRAAQKAYSALLNSRAGIPHEAFSAGVSPRRVIQPLVLPWHHRRMVRRLNSYSLRWAIQRILVEEGIRARPVLVTGTPPSAPLVGSLNERASFYLCMDDFLYLPNVSAEMLSPLEDELLSKVDATIATAAALVESKRPFSGRSFALPQGVHAEHFALERKSPDALASLPRPIIGFSGGVTTPVDFELIRRIATSQPAASVVLVGPVGSDIPRDLPPNVHLFGKKPYDELPAFVQAFDVGIIPYVINAHTIAVDPLKLLEYLAAGIPVVTSALPEAEKYRAVVSICRSHDEFVTAVASACGIGKACQSEHLRAFARKHTWAARADRLLEILAEVTCEVEAGKSPSRPVSKR